MQTFVAILLALSAAATALPPQSTRSPNGKVPAFLLAGDSTTAIDGGWGNGLLATLKGPAFGLNVGKSGATTKSFRNGGYWQNVTDHVTLWAETYDVYVTISFGHNDQKEGSGVNLTQFKDNLINFGNEVKDLGGKPIFVSSLTRRNFPKDQPNNATDSLHDQRILALEAANVTNSAFVDLNAASLNYINQIGTTEADKYNWGPNGTVGTDHTHLNPWGEVVFGRMVADLTERELPCLDFWIKENKTLSEKIWNGLPA